MLAIFFSGAFMAHVPIHSQNWYLPTLVGVCGAGWITPLVFFRIWGGNSCFSALKNHDGNQNTCYSLAFATEILSFRFCVPDFRTCCSVPLPPTNTTTLLMHAVCKIQRMLGVQPFHLVILFAKSCLVHPFGKRSLFACSVLASFFVSRVLNECFFEGWTNLFDKHFVLHERVLLDVVTSDKAGSCRWHTAVYTFLLARSLKHVPAGGILLFTCCLRSCLMKQCSDCSRLYTWCKTDCTMLNTKAECIPRSHFCFKKGRWEGDCLE